MSGFTYILLFTLLCQPTLPTNESKFISNGKTKTLGNVLYISWNVNVLSPHENKSSLVHYQVHYCPLDEYGEKQNCYKRNISLCNATYQRLSNVLGNISIQQDELKEYLQARPSRDMIFEENTSAFISGQWNETVEEFICVVHGISECQVAYEGMPGTSAIYGQVMIIASTLDSKEKEILGIEQNQEPSKYLNQPKDVMAVQTGTNTVTVKWKACLYDSPTAFNVTFYEEGGKIIKCPDTSAIEQDYRRDWESNCSFAHLLPYTVYNVHIYSHAERNFIKSRSIAGMTTFRTKEEAPSSPPSFECVICEQNVLDNGKRLVRIRWKLPPRNQFNGLVRQTILKYWESRNLANTSKLITYNNMTTKGYIKLDVNVEYLVQVKICTLRNLCSPYNEGKLIHKVQDKQTMISGNSITWITNIVLGASLPSVYVVFTVVVVLYCRRKMISREKSKADGLESLSEGSDASGTGDSGSKINPGFPRKDSIASSEYDQLPCEVPGLNKKEEDITV